MEENLTLPQLFEKYPHLARLQFDEMKEEQLSEEIGSYRNEIYLSHETPWNFFRSIAF